VGGGAFSGKDPTKVDRSAAYMARKIACDLVEAHDLQYCEVQLAYGIGEREPMSVAVYSSLPVRDAVYAEEVRQKYDLTPWGIIQALDLLNVKYEELAEGCHYRRKIRRTAHDENCRR
jgi:S-adenosylmethionine synthetase